MATSLLISWALLWAVTIAAHSTQDATVGRSASRIRFDNGRIGEVFRYAMKKSPSFEDLVQTMESQDRVVYVEEGRCQHGHINSCLQIMATPGGRNIQIRIDPRESIKLVVARLAHELFHASEIARDPSIVDAAGLRALYKRIGHAYEPCHMNGACWETRAAVAFEALVTRELNEQKR